MRFITRILLLVSLAATFVHAQTNLYRILDPYFQIASQYGFANYMFSTHQGPSFPGHQFLFSGTSAPTAPTDTTDTCGPWPCYQWFDAENLNAEPAGCVATAGAAAYDIDPDSDTETPVYNKGYPCYTHNSLPTLLDSANPPITWRYYLREGKQLNQQGTGNGYTIWNAPAAISNICYPTTGNPPSSQCEGSDYQNNVFSVLPRRVKLPERVRAHSVRHPKL